MFLALIWIEEEMDFLNFFLFFFFPSNQVTIFPHSLFFSPHPSVPRMPRFTIENVGRTYINVSWWVNAYADSGTVVFVEYRKLCKFFPR